MTKALGFHCCHDMPLKPTQSKFGILCETTLFLYVIYCEATLPTVPQQKPSNPLKPHSPQYHNRSPLTYLNHTFPFCYLLHNFTSLSFVITLSQCITTLHFADAIVAIPGALTMEPLLSKRTSLFWHLVHSNIHQFFLYRFLNLFCRNRLKALMPLRVSRLVLVAFVMAINIWYGITCCQLLCMALLTALALMTSLFCSTSVRHVIHVS